METPKRRAASAIARQLTVHSPQSRALDKLPCVSESQDSEIIDTLDKNRQARFFASGKDAQLTMKCWRNVLYFRYKQSSETDDSYSVEWEDRDAQENVITVHKNFLDCGTNELPKNLSKTVCRVWKGETKLITITLYFKRPEKTRYMSGTCLIQGHAKVDWVKTEFRSLCAYVKFLRERGVNASKEITTLPPVECGTTDTTGVKNIDQQQQNPNAPIAMCPPEAASPHNATNDITLPQVEFVNTMEGVLDDASSINHQHTENRKASTAASAPDAASPVDATCANQDDSAKSNDTDANSNESTTGNPSMSHRHSASADPTPPSITDILRQLTEAQSLIADLQTEMASVKTENGKLNERCTSLETRLEQVDKRQREEAAQADKDLSTVNTNLNSSLQTVSKNLKEETAKLSTTIDSHDGRITHLSTQIKQMRPSYALAASNPPDNLKNKHSPTLTPLVPSASTPSKTRLPLTNVTPPTEKQSDANSSQSDSGDEKPSPRDQRKQANVPVNDEDHRDGDSNDSVDGGKPNSNASKKAEAKSKEEHKEEHPPSPLERLTNTRIRRGVNTLILGDSITRNFDQEKMSVGQAVVQNISISGLSVHDVIDWLRKRSPSHAITHVTFHVGINSCGGGPVETRTWLQVIDELLRVFPRAHLQASSIIPPRGRHYLSQAVHDSNVNLSEACRRTNISFLDNTPVFTAPSGWPKLKLYNTGRDQIHLSKDGARRLALNIRFGGPDPRIHDNHQRDTTYVSNNHHQVSDNRSHMRKDNQPMNSNVKSEDPNQKLIYDYQHQSTKGADQQRLVKLIQTLHSVTTDILSFS